MSNNYEIKNEKKGFKKHLSLLIRLVVSLGLIGYIIYSIASRSDLSLIPRYYAYADYWWLGAAVVSIVLLLSLGAFRWGILLRAQGVPLSAKSIFMYFMIGMFFNNFLPSTVGGDAVKIYYLHRFCGKGRQGFVSVLVDRLVGIAGLCLVADIGLIVGWHKLMAYEALASKASLIILVVGGLTLCLIGFFLVVFNDRLMSLFFRLIPRRLQKIDEKIREIHDCFLLYRGKWGVIFSALGVSCFIWVVIVLSGWMIYQTFYSPEATPDSPQIAFIPISYFYLFIPTISAIMSVPISFGGLGTREAFFILFFSALPGISEMDALMISINYYFAFLFASAIGGVIYIFKDQLRFHRELN